MQIVAAGDKGMDDEDAICDAITNLMHLAHARGMSVPALMQNCLGHFLFETDPSNHEGDEKLQASEPQTYRAETDSKRVFESLMSFVTER